MILAYAIIRHISFQTLSINKLKDGGNVFSPDGRTPRKSRSPLLPKRQSSIIPTSPTTPIKFGSRIFTTPAIIEGVVDHMRPPLNPKEQEQNLIKGKVSFHIFRVLYLLRFSPTVTCIILVLKYFTKPVIYGIK